jgi:hypothetical protein
MSVLLTTAVVLTAGCTDPPPPVTVTATVERDGKAVLSGTYGVGPGFDPVAMWYALEGKRLRAVGPLTPDPADPTAAVLTGEVRVGLTRDGKPVAAPLLDRLRVVRVPGTEDQWEIPRDELERATKTTLRPGFDPKKVP